MNARGVCISGGSACNEHRSTPSQVLTAMGMSNEDALSTVRVSFGLQNKLDEVVEAAKIMVECVNQLRKVR